MKFVEIFSESSLLLHPVVWDNNTVPHAHLRVQLFVIHETTRFVFVYIFPAEQQAFFFTKISSDLHDRPKDTYHFSLFSWQLHYVCANP